MNTNSSSTHRQAVESGSALDASHAPVNPNPSSHRYPISVSLVQGRLETQSSLYNVLGNEQYHIPSKSSVLTSDTRTGLELDRLSAQAARPFPSDPSPYNEPLSGKPYMRHKHVTHDDLSSRPSLSDNDRFRHFQSTSLPFPSQQTLTSYHNRDFHPPPFHDDTKKDIDYPSSYASLESKNLQRAIPPSPLQSSISMANEGSPSTYQSSAYQDPPLNMTKPPDISYSPPQDLDNADADLVNSAPPQPDTATKKKKSKMHECEVCGKMFPRPSGLKTHMNTHNNLKPFPCGFNGCTRTFTVRSNAKRHLRTHGIDVSVRSRSTTSSPYVVGFDTPTVLPPVPNTDRGATKAPYRVRWMPLSLTSRKNAQSLRSLSDNDSDSEDDHQETGEESGSGRPSFESSGPTLPTPLEPVDFLLSSSEHDLQKLPDQQQSFVPQ